MGETTPTLPLRCPRCHGSIVSDILGWVCVGCTAKYEDAQGFIDFLPDVYEPPQRGIGPAAMEHPVFARVYERVWRPLYTAVGSGRLAPAQEELDWLLDQLTPAEGGLCLDLSCGPGIIGRKLLASGRFERVFGLDYSPAMLRQCLDHCAREGVRDFSLVRGDASTLPLQSDSVDAIHAGNALHLWPSVLDALREVRRVLRPGGVFVATTFVRGEGWRRWATASFERATTTRFFDDGELGAACRAAGLVEYAERVQGNAIWLRAQAPRAGPADGEQEGA